MRQLALIFLFAVSLSVPGYFYNIVLADTTFVLEPVANGEDDSLVL